MRTTKPSAPRSPASLFSFYLPFLEQAKSLVRRMLHVIVALTLLGGLLGTAAPAQAQDPSQPATNYGLTNAMDAIVPGPGFYFFEYQQYYDAQSIKDGQGNDLGTAELSSMLFMQQFVYLSKARALGGYLGGTALVPIVSLNSSGRIPVGPSQTVPLTSSDRILGDLIVGPLIQWPDKRLFGLKYHHLFEVDFYLPTGNYDTDKALTPSSNFVSVQPWYAYTLFLTPRLTYSQRHHFTYNFENPDTDLQTGSMYHANYTINYRFGKALGLGVTGYYLFQLTEDSANGNDEFFQQQFGIENTKEQAFAIGPNVNVTLPNGMFIEFSTIFETAVEDRPSGTRTTLRINVPLAGGPPSKGGK